MIISLFLAKPYAWPNEPVPPVIRIDFPVNMMTTSYTFF